MNSVATSITAVPAMRDNFCKVVLQGANDPQICALVTPGDDLEEGSFTRNGRRIHTYFAPAIGTPKGDVVLLYGFTDSTALHPSDIKAIQQMGYNVHSMDWYGQGLSGRPLPNKPTVPSSDFGGMVDDLAAFIQQKVEPRRVHGGALHVTAHSMGGHLALRYIHDKPQTFDSAVLIAPMLDLNAPKDLKTLAGGVASIGVLIGAGDRRLIRFDPSVTAANDDHQSLYARAQGALKNIFHMATHPTIGWLNSALSGIRQVRREDYQAQAAKHTDIHFVAGGRDNVVGDIMDDIHVGKVLMLKDAGHSPLSDSEATRTATLDYMRNAFAAADHTLQTPPVYTAQNSTLTPAPRAAG